MIFPRTTHIRVCLLAMLLLPMAARATPAADVQARIDNDVAAGKPIVVHLVVALCDNENQGIVPVPKAIGNGQDPKSNLYWGAQFGVRNYLPKQAGWHVDAIAPPAGQPILDRAVFHTSLKRNGKAAPVYIVADAWDGAHMREALTTFFEMAAGRGVEDVLTGEGSRPTAIRAGGASHLVGFIGHNGLMDFTLPEGSSPAGEVAPRSALVLACMSQSYFQARLETLGAHPLLLTTNFMAPEAYSLDAAIRAWITQGETAPAVEAAAQAYHRYQKCGIKGARRLFWGAP